MTIRVLHVITSLDVGGAQKHLLALVRRQRERGYLADVAFFKNPTLIDGFKGTGATVYDLSTRSTFAPMLLPRLAGILRRGRYQVVHTHLLKADTYGTLAGVLAGTPVRIASKHNDERALLNPVVATVHGLISHLNNRITVLSDYVGRYIATTGRVDEGRITRVYYGLSSTASVEQSSNHIRRELGIAQDAPLTATVGRLTEQKGLIYLMEAMALVRKTLPDARLLVVGDTQDGRDEYKQRLLELHEQLGLGDAVVFTGVRDDVPHVLAEIDLFVMASLWEGFGLVFLEAMAAGKPVVASAVSAVPEVVEDGKTGLLVPPGNPRALAEAMLALLTDTERAQRMGAAGRVRLRERFSEERMVDQVVQIYAEQLRRRR